MARPVRTSTRSPGANSTSSAAARSAPASPGWAYDGIGTPGSRRLISTSGSDCCNEDSSGGLGGRNGVGSGGKSSGLGGQMDWVWGGRAGTHGEGRTTSGHYGTFYGSSGPRSSGSARRNSGSARVI